MKDNLITISKDAAKTIGLNEAVLLEILKSIPNNPNNFDPEVEEIKELAPFLDSDQIEELLGSLKAKGILERKGHNRLSSTDRSKKNKYSPGLETSKSFKNKIDTFLENDWMPHNSTFKQAAEYGIPEDFALSYLDDFKHFCKEKKERARSWENKFLKFIIKKWRYHEIKDYQESRRKTLSREWKPDQEAIEILTKSGITQKFVEDEINEFILYWKEKGDKSNTWNSKFISQVRRQWAKSEHLIEDTETPFPIKSSWKPNNDFYEVLSLTNIDKKFAESAIPEFILYWKETGQSHNSWNGKFFQHIKYQWQKHQKNLSEIPTGELNKRIESSWDTQKQKGSHSPLRQEQSKEKIKTNLNKLKQKYNI